MCQIKNTFCDNILTSMHYYDSKTRVRHSGITKTPPCPGQALLARSFNPCLSSFSLHGVIQIHPHEWSTKSVTNLFHLWPETSFEKNLLKAKIQFTLLSLETVYELSINR